MARPPIHFTDEELHILGKEMLQWLKDNSDNNKIVHLSQFYSEVKEINRSAWHAIRQRDQFLHYYECALEMMTAKMIYNKDFPTSYGNRYLSVYDKDVRDHEKETKFEVIDHEAQVKSEASNKNQTSPNDCLLSDLIKAVKESK